MSEPLKHMYNPQFFDHLCPVIKEAVPNFGERRFLYSVFDKTWPDLELKQRTRQVTKALGACLPSDYPKAIEMVVYICQLLQDKKEKLPTYPFIFLPDYIEQYGMDHLELSMRAIEESTKLVSAEFAIRPFINKERKLTRYRLDYIVDYVTQTGNISTKIFKLSESHFEPGNPVLFKRKKSFADCSTRKHFKGYHQLRIIGNGVELATRKFFVQ